MNRMLKVFIISLFMASLSFGQYVAVLETVTDSKDLLTPSERLYLTNMLREQAVLVLPAEQGYTILTRENISEMLPPGKTLEECEGSCLAETGKNIQSDFVTQARIAKVGSNLAISVELYETAGSKLVSSFNGLGADVDALMGVISAKAPALFKKVRRGASGIMRTGFDAAGNQSFVVNVTTSPPGAALSIDGRPVPSCPSTPCQVLAEAGDHRFLAVLDKHEDAERIVSVTSNGQSVSFDMVPRYGTLVFNLDFPAGGSVNELKMTVDGREVLPAPQLILDPGVHTINVSHGCYSPVSFKVGISKDKEEVFKETLRPVTGGLSLKARSADGEEIVLPVYANGKQIGETPYVGSVPVCAKLSIGESPSIRPLNVEIKSGEVVNFEYVEPVQSAGVKRRRANARTNTVSNTPATSTPARGTSIPSNVSTSSPGMSLGDHAEWLLPVSACIVGLGLAFVLGFDIDAEQAYKEADASNYQEKMKEAKDAQTIRNVGWGITAVGGFGLVLGLTFEIIDF